MHDTNFNQSKLKANNTYMKYEKKTTNFEPHKIEVVVNKAYLETEISKKDGHLSIIKKDYNEYKLRNDKDAQTNSMKHEMVDTLLEIVKKLFI